MIERLKKLITLLFEFISDDHLYKIDKDNPIRNRDDVVQIHREIRNLVSHLRIHLNVVSETSEEIDFLNKQMKSIVEREK